ncbi:MAG: SEC-C domain-containing protein [Deltaproteobacteria bacterium]|nr:SEC-C domain-containing protein [Deltaproteobacteria bacterium]
MLHVIEALSSHRICPCDCDANLPLAERTTGIAAVYKLDDALRGWGYTPIYDVHGDRLWREAQRRNDPTYRGVAVRFGECIYRRLLGSMIHECLHAICGDVAQANYGILFGLPYGVPAHVPEKEEEAYLDTFNFGEARAWVGVWIVGRRMFGLDWDLRTARDVGTYCFVGGNALVPPVAGFRAVAHIDRQHHPERYYARGRKLEERAREWFASDGNLEMVARRIEEAAAIGERKRPRKYPDPASIARTAPKKIGRNEPCVCGSAQKFKDCCEGTGTLSQYTPSIAR